jgi:hypothetical protein
MNIISVQSRGNKFTIVGLENGRYSIALKRIEGKECKLVSMKEEKSRKVALKVAEDWLGGEEC